MLLLRENKNLLLAKIFKNACPPPSDPNRLQSILARLREAFNAPGACWETMTTNRYEKKFPIINRIIAESFSFDDAVAFFDLFT